MRACVVIGPACHVLLAGQCLLVGARPTQYRKGPCCNQLIIADLVECESTKKIACTDSERFRPPHIKSKWCVVTLPRSRILLSTQMELTIIGM